MVKKIVIKYCQKSGPRDRWTDGRIDRGTEKLKKNIAFFVIICYHVQKTYLRRSKDLIHKKCHKFNKNLI